MRSDPESDGGGRKESERSICEVCEIQYSSEEYRRRGAVRGKGPRAAL